MVSGSEYGCREKMSSRMRDSKNDGYDEKVPVRGNQEDGGLIGR